MPEDTARREYGLKRTSQRVLCAIRPKRDGTPQTRVIHPRCHENNYRNCSVLRYRHMETSTDHEDGWSQHCSISHSHPMALINQSSCYLDSDFPYFSSAVRQMPESNPKGTRLAFPSHRGLQPKRSHPSGFNSRTPIQPRLLLYGFSCLMRLPPFHQ